VYAFLFNRIKGFRKISILQSEKNKTISKEKRTPKLSNALDHVSFLLFLLVFVAAIAILLKVILENIRIKFNKIIYIFV
jgi:hypothetical protein